MQIENSDTDQAKIIAYCSLGVGFIWIDYNTTDGDRLDDKRTILQLLVGSFKKGLDRFGHPRFQREPRDAVQCKL